uniref:FHA domain-containing protein n=1 Tax=Bacteroides acidifaciens TaxID=85831 RepID=UPI0025B5AC54
RIQRSAMGTVMGGPVSGPDASNKFCTLRPIAWEGEEVNYNPITYSGDTIILNRSNTDANNNSFTSREQAILTCEEGEWYIENRSDLRTTFIRVNGKIKLNSGDIIVLGNREFEFKG